MTGAALQAILAASVAATAAASLAAQEAGSKNAPQPLPQCNVALTYAATSSDTIAGNRFWIQGGSGQLELRLYRGLGGVAEVGGAHVANINSSGVGLDMVTAVFGPRYTWAPPQQKYALFAQTLVGVADGFNSVFPAASAPTSSAHSLALEVGGGMNIALSRHVALRAFDAGWLRTQLPNSKSSVQNNLRLGAGVVFSFR
jgi:hypothetical protein